MANKGFFIVIEGLDGSGKTTQTKLLVKKLRKSHNAMRTTEPSKGKIGKFIKSYCLNIEKRGSATVEALLFAADRVEHIEAEVKPALYNGRLVVSDRYVYSSLAYQGATGLDVDWIRRINAKSMKPDLAIYIDVDPEIVVKRLKPCKSIMENLETQRKVRDVYLRFVKSGDLVKIDGNRSTKVVASDILATVLKSLGNW